jgi:hypothetical protein
LFPFEFAGDRRWIGYPFNAPFGQAADDAPLDEGVGDDEGQR